jgi:phosphatidylglycerophosphatase A
MKIEPRQVFTDPRYLLALGFGSGLSPKAPGTIGTIAAIPFFLLLNQLDPIVYAVLVIVAFAGGVFVCDWVANQMDLEDPGPVVFDEFVGLWVALFLLPNGWYWVIVGFLLFRFFDILKPWPVNWLDRNLKGGLGIMADDVAAGVYSLAVLQFVAFVLPKVME